MEWIACKLTDKDKAFLAQVSAQVLARDETLVAFGLNSSLLSRSVKDTNKEVGG